jgi:PAS domain S-box-containing protein
MYQEKDKYRLLIEKLPDGLAYCKMVQDNTGKPLDYIFLEVNSSFEAIIGFPRDHIIGKKVTEVYPGIKGLGFDWIGVFDQVTAIGTGQSIRFQQYLDLAERWYEITAYSDQPGYFATIFHDITERKQADEALKESKERYRHISEIISDIAYSCILKEDGNYTVDWMTGAVELITGYTIDELKALRCWWFLVLKEDLFLLKQHVVGLAQSASGQCELRIRHKNGDIHWLRSFAQCSREPDDTSSQHLYGGLIDITELKQMERELIHSERMAIAGQLAAEVAHEFNNLLSIIGGSSEYAKGIRNENEIKKSLDMIVKSVNRGAQVVKKLLTFAKRIELKKESVDLIEVIEEAVGLVKRDLENNSITVVRNYSDIPKTLIDVGQIQQVFLNLIINAKNAMSKGGKLAINVEKEGKFIKIQFHNTGKVINKEDLPNLFTPFFMTSRQQKKGMPGTGLGLAVSYGIIKAHNGVIKAESVKGKGTTFTVLLAVTKNENMAEVLPKAVAKAVKNNKRKLKQAEILIVDDEVEIGKLFKKVLDKEGYSVTVADRGENALNLCRKKKFDLIYLDIIMPGMDGISVFKKIKEISPKTKIVFFTGKLIEDKVAGMCLDEGAAGFLRKPIPLKDLVSYTQNILKAKNE